MSIATASVLVALISGVVTLLTTWLTRRTTKRQGAALADQGATLAEVREHVANSHTTNLRDDLDGVEALVREVLAGQTAIHTDMRVEREERRDLAQRVVRLESHIL